VSLRILGVDPGLRNTGMCLLELGHENDADCWTIRADGWERMGRAVLTDIGKDGPAATRAPHAIAIEDFVFRSPRISRGVVKHGAEMGKLLGFLWAVLSPGASPVTWVKPSDSKALQPEGRMAKAYGIPGRNDHERSAYYAALYVASTIRLAGGRG
jgi:hypothetical protein